jgi:hypothetical protein
MASWGLPIVLGPASPCSRLPRGGPFSDIPCHARGQIKVTEVQRAATAFLSLVVGGPARINVSENVLDEKEIETRIRFAVRLFLDGVRPR